MIEMSDSNSFGLGHSDKSLICRPIVLPNLFDKVVVVIFFGLTFETRFNQTNNVWSKPWAHPMKKILGIIIRFSGLLKSVADVINKYQAL